MDYGQLNQITGFIGVTRSPSLSSPPRTLDEIKADLKAVQGKAEGLLARIIGEGKRA